MTNAILNAELERIAQSYRRYQLCRKLALCWVWMAVAATCFLLLYGVSGWFAPIVFPLLIGSAAIAASVVWVQNRKTEPAYRWIAEQIERENPKLNTLLLAAVEQKPDAKTGELNFLQERVIREAIDENRKQPWVQKHVERVFLAQCFQWIAFALLAGSLIGLNLIGPKAAARAKLIADGGVSVSPGDTSIERGSGLVVLVRFGDRLPAEATLVLESKAGTNRQIHLAKNLADPVFGGTVPEVNHDLVYHIEYGERGELRTPDFKVQVFDFPALQRSDAQLTYPTYTELPPKRIEDTRRVSAVEGTVLDYSFQLNKPVTSAKLIAKDKSVIPLVSTPDNTRSNLYVAHLTLEESKHYELQLIDDVGRTNKTPTDIAIQVLPNRPAELKLTYPRQDLRVSPLEEVAFQAQASDDFGLRAFGVAYTLAGSETKFVELGKSSAANEKQQLGHLLALEDISAEPDQLLTYFVWAEDLGPDGQVRRSSSDMYFAEVRHFEEIFREGQQPPQSESESMQGQQGNQSQSEKLAELQKQIISATWNLQRRETKAKPTPNYKKDAEVVEESQEKALEQALELQSKTENPRLKPFIDTVVKEMESALKQLSKAVNDTSPKPLPSALTAEQAAYQGLLKLQAREFEVTRNNSRSRSRSSSSGAQRAQQQLDQLELKQSENRYETQKQASSASQQQNSEQREQLQVLNRLKELAQRQQNLNERLKELQTALQEAKTEEEREAARRQLKRLRDDEREILADIDELQQRMNNAENQAQMADARQQLDQTRSDVRQAAEALDKEAASQALASGTRAQRDLQDLREDFRKKTSSQFTEEMRQMRSDARQLAQQEEDLGKKIDTLAQSERKTLSDSAQRNELADKLMQQRSGLTNVLNNMRRVTEQAEGAEPLLSKQLYDTIRKTDQNRINTALTNTATLLRRGFVPQANEPEQLARAGIDELKRGVEKAAESVLGDEAEALRQARNELDELSQQLEREIAQAQGNGQPGQGASSQGQRDPNGQPAGASSRQSTNETMRMASADQAQSPYRGANRQGQQGQGQQGQGQQGQGQQGQGQQGQGQQGQGQQGQGQQGQGQQGQGQQGQGQQGQGQQGQGQQGQGQQGQGQQGQGQQGQGQQGQGQQGQGQQGQGQQGQGQQGQGQQGQGQQGQGQQGQGQQGQGQQGQQGQGQRAQGQQGQGQGGQRRFYEGNQVGGSGGGGNATSGPLTGENYVTWSDRLRDVEEMVDLPEIRNRVAEIRERAREVRSEYKRHSKEPKWDLVQSQIMVPLAEVRSQINEELARRQSPDSLVPIDRDPVPKKFSDLVKRYYEKLGASE
jgi:hypothetical protein